MKSSISSLSISGSSTAAVLALLLQTPTSINAQQSNNIDTFDDIANLNTTSNSTQEAIDTLSSIGLITTPAPPIDSNSNTNNNEAIDIALEQTNSTELQEAIDKLIAAGLMTPTDDETVFQGGISSTVQTDIQTTINEQLVSNILTLDEFNEVRLTESPADFGQLEDSSSYDSEKLWRDAAIFEYEVATSHTSSKSTTSSGYHPYLICSSNPDQSGKQREELINELFTNTPNVSATHYYTEGNLFINTNEMSCGVLRAYDNTIELVLLHHFATDSTSLLDVPYMNVNPLHSSMKMIVHTVDVLESWFSGSDSIDLVTIGAGDMENDDEDEDEQIQVKILGIQTLLCPGVQDFNNEVIANVDIVKDIKSFITDGESVKMLSYYNHLVEMEDDANESSDTKTYTPRMKQWSDAVSTVTSWTNDEDGSNPCLDGLIGQQMKYEIDGKSLVITAKYSLWEAQQVFDELGISKGDGETCIWYMTYALGVSPMICSVGPKTGVKTLCKDGTSDLSKCPIIDESSSNGSSGKSRFVAGVVMSAVFVAFSLGML